jgi:branched-chain amino acid transport system substrate-binding protein
MKRTLRRTICLLLAILMISSVLGGCAKEETAAPASGTTPAATPTAPAAGSTPAASTPAAPAAKQEVLVGVMTSLSGTRARSGELYQNGVLTALQHIEEDGFLKNYTLKLEFFDDQGTTEGAPIAANLAINNKVKVCLGHTLTPMVMISGQYFEEAKIPLIGSVSGPAVCQQGWKFYHNGTVTDTDAADALAEYLVKVRGVKRVFVMALNDEGGIVGAQAVLKKMQELGANVVGYELFGQDDTDFTAQILKAKEGNADCIIAYQTSSAANGYTVYQQIESLIGDIPTKVVLAGSTAFAGSAMLEAWPKEDLAGILFPTGYIADMSDPMKKRFADDFVKRDRLHIPPSETPARMYDALWNICQALNDMGPYDVNAADFSIKLNDALSKVKRVGLQGQWNYGAFTDGRGLASGNVGMWNADGTMTKVYPK